MSVFQAAREAATKSMGGGNWLDDKKDDMIREQAVFGIRDVQFDETGSQFGPRWIVSLEPWYDGDEDPRGDLSFKDTAYRNKFFSTLQDELDRQGDDAFLGPCCLIKAKTANGKNRYYDIVEWDEAKGQPVGQAPAVPEPAPAPVSSGRARPGRPAAPAAEEEPAPKRRGRPAKAAAAQPEPAGDDDPEPDPALTPRNRTRPASAVPGDRQARPDATIPRGGGAQAGEIAFTPGQQGRATCGACEDAGREDHTFVQRIFPGPDGNPVMIHNCPITKASMPLPAEPLAAEDDE